METLYFVLGVLTMVAVGFITAFVLGMLKIFKLQQQINSIEQNFEPLWNEIRTNTDEITRIIESDRHEHNNMIENIYRRISEMGTDCKSYTDSRIDKAVGGPKRLLKD